MLRFAFPAWIDRLLPVLGVALVAVPLYGLAGSEWPRLPELGASTRIDEDEFQARRPEPDADAVELVLRADTSVYDRRFANNSWLQEMPEPITLLGAGGGMVALLVYLARRFFGHAKEARNFRRFSLRGARKVAREWTLVCLCGNLLKLVNSGFIPTQRASQAI